MKSLLSALLSLLLFPGSARAGADYAVSEVSIRKAPCHFAVARTDQEIQNHFLQRADRITSENTAQGFSFKNDSAELIRVFKNLTEADPYSEIRKDTRLLATAAGHCSTVICATEYLFGKDNAWKVLYLNSRFNLNVSHLRFDHASAWRSAELDTILNALSFVPTELSRFSENKKLVHYRRGAKDPRNESSAVAANSEILVYDFWNTLSEEKQIYILLHEFAHLWALRDDGNDLDRSEDWLHLTGWEMIPAIPDVLWQHNGQKTFWVSNYAQSNSIEDFAESVMAYLFEPQKLQRNDPAKYSFLKKSLFKGKDFHQPGQCAN
ncbi:hypothetical protein EZJ49_01030 [Bdellovibrio bacteriovorus]|uniref:hypothetical protein n=1 Tax=Bdellovibrio bacteriovorus TaxID=959 RepID=UPI0021D08450|nr:hypothetical protein [Bdellovibrio bacteriovorus]UXR64838.1 hypothetical protein EZJ49_01030 [Bdellovibrio bacteriovorus]